jgi:DNA invertase Pin-like site-specific DNA recombinase
MGRFLGYRRVSRVGGRDETLISPQLQEQAIRRWAEGAGHEIEMLPPELDASGGDDSRPVLLGAIEQIERGEADGLAVWKFDRFTRSLRHSLEMLERIESIGGQLRSASEQLDPDTVAGRLHRNITFSIAQSERESKAEGIAQAKADAIRRGLYISPVTPLGYRKREDRRLEPDPVAAPVVRELFARRAAGDSYRILAELVREKLGRPFLEASVRGLLKNPAYLGVSRQGEIRNLKAHQPLVDRAMWEAAQTHQPRPPRSTREGLLRGLLFCCGCSMRMTTGYGRSARYYRCRVTHASGRCQDPASIEANLIEPYITEVVLDYLDQLGADATSRTSAVAEAEARLAAADGELAAFQEITSITSDGAEFFQAGMRSRIDAVNAARRELADSKQRLTVVPDPVTLGQLWPDLSIPERRQILGGAIGGVWVSKGRGLDRIAVISPEHRPDRPRRGGPARPLISVNLADIPGQIRPPGAKHGE